jgi:TRAP-type C4-dicarboxylate transport system permease small subunit
MIFLNKISDFLNKMLVLIGGVFLVNMILLTCADIVLRKIWIPISGAVELVGFFGAIVAAFALGDTQRKRGHIAVEVLINTFPKWIRRALSVLNSGMCLLFFVAATWQVAIKAATLRHTGEVSETLRIIYYPFTYSVALGCAVLALVFLMDMIKAVFPKKEGKI